MSKDNAQQIGGPDIGWAYRIVARANAGDAVGYLALKWAKEVVAKWGKQDAVNVNVEVRHD